MAEEVKNEDVKIEQDLAKLIVGSDNTATSEIGGYKFKYHYPGLVEDLKIQTVAKNLRKELEKDDDPDIRLQTVMLATFEVICDEIIKIGEKPEVLTVKDNLGNSVRKMKFVEFVESLKKVNPWGDFVIPLYSNFLNFANEVFVKEKELKN